MAVPAHITMLALGGSFIQNKALSDDTDPIMKLRGVSYLLRKTLGLVTVKNDISQYTDDDKIVHIEIKTEDNHVEHRILDWVPRTSQGRLSGEVETQSRFYTDASVAPVVASSAEDLKFLNADVLIDRTATAQGWSRDGQPLLHTVVKSVRDGWTMEQVWGFEMINGVRYQTRRIVAMKGCEIRRARLVFNVRV